MDEPKNIGLLIAEYLLEEKNMSAIDPELETWLEANSENKKKFHVYKKIWSITSMHQNSNTYSASEAWEKVNHLINKKQIRKRKALNTIYALSGMAASLLIILGFSFYLGLFSPNNEIIQISTAKGNRSEVVLPDGSIVNLNAESNIKYTFDKVKKQRKVVFYGEGLFNVAKSDNPFIINTGNQLTIKVLGTKFNLSNYADQNTIQTALIEGKVELSTSDSNHLIINSGEIAKYNKEKKMLIRSTGEPIQASGWMTNKLYMDNMPLEEVCQKLEKWYDAEILFSNPEIGKEFRYTGVLQEETVYNVLDALCKLSDITYSVYGKKINISYKNNTIEH